MELNRSISPQRLGAERFRHRYGLTCAYVAGSMAHGVASERFVEAMTGAGLLASFGSAGLSHARVRAAVARLKGSVPDRRLCINLIHSPQAETVERNLVELLLRESVTAVEASAFIQPTLALVLYRARGARVGSAGPQAAQRIIAKVSRREVARHFMLPPPADMLRRLCEEGALSASEADAAGRLALADDITVEADSGGHTDNQPLLCAFPAIRALRDEIAQSFAAAAEICIGAGGGLGTPAALASAFALGADYVVTGSINQACIEAGTSDGVKALLAQAEPGDFAMAPAADMFEMGVRVQVLRRGTMFPVRAQWLYELYRQRDGLDALSADERERLERQLFRRSIDDVWQETRAYWQEVEPQQLALAEQDPRLRMAMVFRWYLGTSSRWAISGDPQGALDYQIWCGPAMASFNIWSRGVGLGKPEDRSAPAVALALMEGAARHLDALWRAPTVAPPQSEQPAAPPVVVEPDAGFIRDWLIAQIAQQISIASEEIDPSQPFESYGIDSGAAVMILGRLERLLHRRLSPTLIWNYPNIDALAARLSAPVRAVAGQPHGDRQAALPPG